MFGESFNPLYRLILLTSTSETSLIKGVWLKLTGADHVVMLGVPTSEPTRISALQQMRRPRQSKRTSTAGHTGRSGQGGYLGDFLGRHPVAVNLAGDWNDCGMADLGGCGHSQLLVNNWPGGHFAGCDIYPVHTPVISPRSFGPRSACRRNYVGHGGGWDNWPIRGNLFLLRLG